MTDFPYQRVLITGGTGTLGHAILRRAVQENWGTHFVVLSRDPNKQHLTKEKFPELKLSFVTGDVLWNSAVLMAMNDCDLVIHAAAMKHIPEGERDPVSTAEVNVNGSMIVASAAHVLGIQQVIGISTDKACKPHTVYGASKMMMERVFQAWARVSKTRFNLCRYGNVLGSNGSVLQVWKHMEEKDGIVHATDPNMTRFWLSPSQAVDVILHSLANEPSGTISVPDLPALEMGQMAKWVLKPTTKIIYEGLRPGEKYHEDMISEQEGVYTAVVLGKKMNYFRIYPTDHPVELAHAGLDSSMKQMQWREFEQLLKESES